MNVGNAPLTWSAPRRKKLAVAGSWAQWRRLAVHLSGRVRRELAADAEAVERLQIEWQAWDDATLDARLHTYRARVRRGEMDEGDDRARSLRIEALAAVSLAAQRTIERLPYRVQVLAALAMHAGCVVQMAAGEGKTLAVAVAAVLHGWRRLPCHVVTSNDYLAARDVELMRPLYARCSVSVRAVVHETPQEALPEHYAADVVYATSKQLLADYLRDAIVLEGALDPVRRRIHHLGARERTRMRGLYAAIVDEADNVLIDEAVTPLIISASQPNPMLTAAVTAAHALAAEMSVGVDYTVAHEFRDVVFTRAGKDKLEAMTHELPPVWHAPERREDLMRQALVARDVYLLDRHYIIEDGKVVILDESTGRAMPGRSWSYGLHQAIEAHEGVEITHPAKTMARMSFQEFFTHFHRLSGASGTLQGVKGELWWTYGLPTLTVPTRKPSQLRVPKPLHFPDRDAKWRALIDTVVSLHAKGVPVLVGTRRLGDSEALQLELGDRGLACEVLNAKQLAREADIVALAGLPNRITVATNMAGRGTDILISPEVEAMGGLHVLVMEPHESARVDWQLFGRAGRHGAPGFAQSFVAMDDDLLTRHLPIGVKTLLQPMRRAPGVRAALLRPLLWLAQAMAQSQSAGQRKAMREREKQLRKQLSFAGELGS